VPLRLSHERFWLHYFSHMSGAKLDVAREAWDKAGAATRGAVEWAAKGGAPICVRDGRRALAAAAGDPSDESWNGQSLEEQHESRAAFEAVLRKGILVVCHSIDPISVVYPPPPQPPPPLPEGALPGDGDGGGARSAVVPYALRLGLSGQGDGGRLTWAKAKPPQRRSSLELEPGQLAPPPPAVESEELGSCPVSAVLALVEPTPGTLGGFAGVVPEYDPRRPPFLLSIFTEAGALHLGFRQDVEKQAVVEGLDLLMRISCSSPFA
jgi:hypothetical protein